MQVLKNLAGRAVSRVLTLAMLAALLAGCGPAQAVPADGGPEAAATSVPTAAPATPPAATAAPAATVAPADAPEATVAATAGSIVVAEAAYWPTEGWRTAEPESQGMDGAALAQLAADIAAQGLPMDSLLIIRNGYIVSETYYGANTAETRHALYSCTKSFTSTLFGIARDRGLIGDLDEAVLDALAGRTFGHTDARKQAMTLEHLLTMTTGLDWTENDAAYRNMYVSDDWVDQVMDERMREDPGTAFNYCSGCTHVISAVIHEATGQDGVEFAQEALLAPLGITAFGWERDSSGLPIGGWGLQLAPRDMAKLGYLFLHGGEWDGEQVVSAEWVQAATTAQVPVGDEVGYGYQWWVHPEVGGYAAEGRYGQTIFVAPAENLIVVTTANGFDNHDPIYELISERILPAITD